MKRNLQQLFDEFMFEREFVQRLRKETLRGERNCMKTLFSVIPYLSLDTLNSSNMATFFKTIQERNRYVGKGELRIGVKNSTIVTYWKHFNVFFEWLKMKKHIRINPLNELKKPNISYEEKQYLNKNQMETILSTLVTCSYTSFLLKRNLVIYYLLAYCGLRREELLELQISDIDLENKLLTIRAETSKSLRSRQLPINTQLIDRLKDYINARKLYTTPYLLVSNSKNAKFSNSGLKHWTDKLNKVSGVRFHVHQFRHTFAVNFLLESGNLAKLQQLMGHKDPTMSLQYVRCLPPNEFRIDVENLRIHNFA